MLLNCFGKQSVAETWARKVSKNLQNGLRFFDMIMEAHKDKNALNVNHSANARVINYYSNGKPKYYDFSKSVTKNGGLLTFENSKI